MPLLQGDAKCQATQMIMTLMCMKIRYKSQRYSLHQQQFILSKHTLSSLSLACCLNFSKLLADETGREWEELEVLVRVDHEGTWRNCLGTGSWWITTTPNITNEFKMFQVTLWLTCYCQINSKVLSAQISKPKLTRFLL